MKKSAIIAVAAAVVAVTVPVVAQQSPQEKVICELASKNCLNQVEILQKRVKKLNEEIKKGTRAYPTEDLKKLELKLQETMEMLDKLEGKKPGK